MDAMYKTMETTQWKSAADTNKAHAHAVQLIRATQTTHGFNTLPPTKVGPSGTVQCHITAEVQKMATGNYTAMSSSGLGRVATERNRIRRAERTTMQYGLPAHRPITSVGQHARAI